MKAFANLSPKVIASRRKVQRLSRGADTGPGVAPDEQERIFERIFERFFRGAAGRKMGGTGIGLTVVKELVQAHDGEIQLQGSPGEGARVIVRLPPLTDHHQAETLAVLSPLHLH